MKKKISRKYWNIGNFIEQFVKYRLFAENGYDDIWYMSFSGFFYSLLMVTVDHECSPLKIRTDLLEVQVSSVR